MLGLEQSSVWGWSSVLTWACIIVGLVLMLVFVRYELSIKYPLLRLQIFLDRAFAADTLILGLMSIVFVPFFFFGSVYAQVALGKNSSQAGEYILWFFIGFVIMAQVGGRMLDRRGVKPAVVLGGALGAVGFFLLAGKLTDLSLGAQSLYIALAGGGLGLMLGPASTDAVNRAPSTSYSEVTGITQTARNFGASLGLAVLGAILISRNDTNVTKALTLHGVPSGVAHRVAASFSASGAPSGSGSPHTAALVHSVRLAFAHSTQTVFYIMAGVMVATFIVAVRRLPRGRLESADEQRGGCDARRRARGDDAPLTGDDLVTKVSPRSVEDTVARFSEVLAAKGVKLFAVIDHSGEAAKVGLDLRDTKVVIFGAPQAGTPVMQAVPVAALDLPLKVAVWDDDGRTTLTYTAPAALAARYGLSDDLAARLAAIDPLTDAVVSA